MADLIFAQSMALVVILFCSCFTTQYLLLRYKKQSHDYWARLFSFFFAISVAVIFLWFPSIEIFILFVTGIISEFLKRYCYYINYSLISFSAMLSSVSLFIIFIACSWLDIFNLNHNTYLLCYCGARLFPLAGVLIFLYFSPKKEMRTQDDEGIKYAIVDSFKNGGVFSIITIIYWITNQGYFILLQDSLPASELVDLRVTQNVFGIVTMLIALYDSIFLKKNIENKQGIFHFSSFLKFSGLASFMIIINYVLLYVLSVTIYKHIDVIKYSLLLAIAQFFYLMARMPVLILKLRYNLSVILGLYVFALLVSLIFLFTNKNSTDFQYIVQAIALANFIVFISSLFIVYVKEKNYGKTY